MESGTVERSTLRDEKTSDDAQSQKQARRFRDHGLIAVSAAGKHGPKPNQAEKTVFPAGKNRHRRGMRGAGSGRALCFADRRENTHSLQPLFHRQTPPARQHNSIYGQKTQWPNDLHARPASGCNKVDQAGQFVLHPLKTLVQRTSRTRLSM